MTGRRLIVHGVFLFLAPVLVAWMGWSVPAAIALVLLLLAWRWIISLSVFIAPASCPELELETISASHFVEKVRWCMDRLGIDYRERPVAGTLGAFYLGRTVPVLHFRCGAVRSSIGNSREILRYLWGRYAIELGDRAEFLRETRERQALEKRLDRVGVDLQVWVYYHLLDDHELTLHAWGVNNPAIPAWQRVALRVLRPVQTALIRKAFRITPSHYEKAVAHIDALLAEVEEWLGDGRRSLVGGDEINYTDIAFAALMGLWRRPPGYGGPAGENVRIETDRLPEEARAQIERWENRYPACSEFILRMYDQR